MTERRSLGRQSSGGSPYYEDDSVMLYHADCRNLLGAIKAAVLVTDPPYGVAFKSGWTGAEIANDGDTAARDLVLNWWGDKPALVFGAAGEARLGPRVPLVWHRPGSGMGDLDLPWKPDYELIHVLGHGFAHTTRGSSVLRYPWDVFRGDALHPHQKPLGLMRDLLTKCPPGVILDPFAGSGSTLRAAKDVGRRAIGIELEEKYCKVAAERLAQEVLDLAA